MTMLLIALAGLSQDQTADWPEDALESVFRIHAPGAGPSGTSFLVEKPAGTGKEARTILVTAAHVLDTIPGAEARLVLRTRNPTGGLGRLETPIALRRDGRPLYRKAPGIDIAALAVTLPKEAHAKPFSLEQILVEGEKPARNLRLGKDAWVASFPAKAEANQAGQPILRRGTVASRPFLPGSVSNTYLVDAPAFGGDSGAPVMVLENGRPVVAGLVAGMIRETDRSVTPFEEKVTHMPLGISIVIHARFIRQAVDLAE